MSGNNGSKSFVCLNEEHWKIYDRNCVECKSEIKESVLLTELEYEDWLNGKFSLGFDQKRRLND